MDSNMRRARRPHRGAILARLASLVCLALCACVGPAGEPEAPEVPPRLRLGVYNVRHGAGLDGVVDLERTASVLRAMDADVIALQEIDEHCGRTDGVNQAARLGELCGMQAAFGTFMDYDGGRYGMAVLSRLPVLEATNHRLPDGAEPRSALAVRVRLDERHEALVVGLHLYATPAERLAQAERVVERFGALELPVVLAGDLNSLPSSPVLERLGARWAAVPKQGPPETFPADGPQREIDFVLVRPGEWTVDRMEVLSEPLASDHRPLLFEGRLRTTGT